MITLNDYLYSGDTVLKILHNYERDLRNDAHKTGNPIDIIHCNFLLQLTELLEHNDFLTSQSQRIREFYKHMANEYPFLAFTVKGRIKSLIRAEEKFNGYIVEYIHNYYKENSDFPTLNDLHTKLNCFRDLIAYRIVISMPACHIRPDENREEVELKYLYEIASQIPRFLEERGFTAENSCLENGKKSSLLPEDVQPYIRDYVANQKKYGYRALHITFYDNISRSYIEIQLRTKEMDDHAEIGPSNHLGYERRQEHERQLREDIPNGKFIYFDEAYERGIKLQSLELSKIDVNMFGATSNQLVNDGCGLYRGRQILPLEHLSRFQNDIID